MLAILAAMIAVVNAQMPPGLPNRDSYAIRKIDPSAPCRFEGEYRKIRSQKTDPRVAFLELEDFVVADKDERVGFEARCKQLAEQTEDGIVVFDKARGYLHLVFGSPVISTSLAYFSPGVMLYVSRADDEWNAFAFAWRDGKWVDVTKEYLGPLNLASDDLLILPQYGRTLRVLNAFRHKQWLTWDGKRFKPLDAKTGKATWRCPDGLRYFEPKQRAQYCS
jgi:hypothetical protein